MKKFLGEMTFEEFKEALKILICEDLEVFKKFFCPEEKKEENFFIRFLKEIKEFFISIKNFFIGIKTFLKTFLNEFKKFLQEPLTQEVFLKRARKLKAVLYETIETIVFVIVAIIIIRYFIGEIRWIPSASMRPTLIEGDRVFVERSSRFYKSPQRGDIMVFYPPGEELKKDAVSVFKRLTGFFCKDIAFIKRVIGTPGDKIEIVNNPDGSASVFINDILLQEDYVKDRYEYPMCDKTMMCGPKILGNDEYFMMGDNRGHSSDSRYWGTIKKERFIGKAVFIFRLAKL